ncbi:MAG: hypothetical protein IJH07_03675, partial [Ruminococcus sp.]|nr:hypothetical protein [Ruminococcus sp.]
MLKTSKLISLLLVVALMLSVFSGLIVTTSAAAVESATIVYDGQTKNVHVGDTITYTAYMDVTSIPTASDGYVHGVDAVTYYDQSNLTLTGSLGRKNCPSFYSVMFGTDEENAIYYNDVDIDEGFLFEDGSVLITMSFEVVAGGTSTITNKITEMYKAVNGRPKYFYYGSGEQLTDEAPNFKSTLEVQCPHPDEPTDAPAEPTDAPAEPTDAPVVGDKAIVTIYGLDGASETKEFNVGDEFTVYTTLNTSAYENGGIGSLNGTQYYTNAILALTDEYDEDEGDILDLDAMFPITKGNTV